MSQEQNDIEFLKGLSNPGREERARSLLDLIELRVFDLDLAAWFVSLVSQGASFVTGSGPGGIGKSTTMRSLMSFVPKNLPFALALPGEIPPLGDRPRCVMTNELSDHRPPTYLWDQDLRDFCALSEKGCVLAGNVHADDLDEVYEQIVTTCQVPESQFRAINLFVFICLEGGNPSGGRVRDTTTRRMVNKIFYSDGTSAHQSVFSPETGLLPNAPRDAEHEGACRAFLDETLKGSVRTLEDVRTAFLARGWAE